MVLGSAVDGMGRESLLIVGASARAAAESAVAAGLEVDAIDLFADADLMRVARCVRRSVRFPYDILAAARELPPGPWLYTGGLENYPRLVARLAAERPLIGCDAAVLRQVRDLRRLAEFLARSNLGIHLPTVVADAADAAAVTREAGPWLVKRRRSSGGLGIERRSPTAGPPPRGCYRQREIVGTSFGASFLADGRSARFLGTAEQLTQSSADGSLPFRYAGSIADSTTTAAEHDRFAALGDALVAEFALRGLFGVDLIRDEYGRWFLLEINPRPTASMELREPAAGPSLGALHCIACRAGELPNSVDAPSRTDVRGRAIVYAGDLRGQMPPELVERLLGMRPAVADIPAGGTTIAPDQPLVSIYAEAATREAVAARLVEREREVRELFARALVDEHPMPILGATSSGA